MGNEEQVVMVLDDDPAILSSLEGLLSSRGYVVRLHGDAKSLFEGGLPLSAACLLLDNQLGGGITGVQVHKEMLARGWGIPTVFLTAHWNVKSVVNAMRAGADGFLCKPYDPMELLEEVEQALERARISLKETLKVADACERGATLTKREREIVGMVLKGMLNKQIADDLGLALVTVKVHRGRAMQKLGAGNPVELARIATWAGVES